jgi:hypothetical protein
LFNLFFTNRLPGKYAIYVTVGRFACTNGRMYYLNSVTGESSSLPSSIAIASTLFSWKRNPFCTNNRRLQLHLHVTFSNKCKQLGLSIKRRVSHATVTFCCFCPHNVRDINIDALFATLSFSVYLLTDRWVCNSRDYTIPRPTSPRKAVFG